MALSSTIAKCPELKLTAIIERKTLILSELFIYVLQLELSLVKFIIYGSWLASDDWGKRGQIKSNSYCSSEPG